MLWIDGDGLNCLKFSPMDDLPGFFHGIFLRRTGDGSSKPHDFNVGLGQGAPETQVWQNRQKMVAFFGEHNRGVYARQVHGDKVAVLIDQGDPETEDTPDHLRLEGDALITNVPGMALVIQVADCQPVIIIDPVEKVVANVHSGWRGSVRNIIGATIQRMALDFDCRPENLVCGVGPSLGPCCAEFINFQDELPESIWKYRREEYLFDFWQISVDQLTGAGVRPDHIRLAGMCTKCNQHLFFSYRGERDTGRFAAVVGIDANSGSGE